MRPRRAATGVRLQRALNHARKNIYYAHILQARVTARPPTHARTRPRKQRPLHRPLAAWVVRHGRWPACVRAPHTHTRTRLPLRRSARRPLRLRLTVPGPAPPTRLVPAETTDHHRSRQPPPREASAIMAAWTTGLFAIFDDLDVCACARLAAACPLRRAADGALTSARALSQSSTAT